MTKTKSKTKSMTRSERPTGRRTTTMRTAKTISGIALGLSLLAGCAVDDGGHGGKSDEGGTCDVRTQITQFQQNIGGKPNAYLFSAKPSGVFTRAVLTRVDRVGSTEDDPDVVVTDTKDQSIPCPCVEFFTHATAAHGDLFELRVEFPDGQVDLLSIRAQHSPTAGQVTLEDERCTPPPAK
jgi:hypothetical protein